MPLQGRIRQEGETVEDGVTDSDEEEEGRAVRPKVARVPKGSPRVPLNHKVVPPLLNLELPH